MKKSKCIAISGLLGAVIGLILFITFSVLYGDLWNALNGSPYIAILYSTILIPTLIGLISGTRGKIRASISATVVIGIVCFIIGFLIFGSWYI